MPLGNIYKTLTKSQVETHSVLGRQQGQVKGSGQEVGETCLPVATSWTTWVALHRYLDFSGSWFVNLGLRIYKSFPILTFFDYHLDFAQGDFNVNNRRGEYLWFLSSHCLNRYSILPLFYASKHTVSLLPLSASKHTHFKEWMTKSHAVRIIYSISWDMLDMTIFLVLIIKQQT